MAKTITLKWNDAEYVLEFTRESVERLEDSGFNIADVKTKPVSTLPTLFKGAFLAHCSYLKDDVLDEIYKSIEDKVGFMEKLIEMYAEPVEALLHEPEPSEKNARWEASF